jgi:hypothetical protein
MKKKTIVLDGRGYRVSIHQKLESSPEVPRLLIPAFLPNAIASDILRVCIRSIQQHTDMPVEIWVVDNFSPAGESVWLAEEKGINVIFNHSAPIPPDQRRWWHAFRAPLDKLPLWGSYSNAIGLELARAVIPSSTKWLVTLHMDTMPVASHWLSFLMSKCNQQTRAAGVRMDRGRTAEGVLHVLGYLVDYQLFQTLGMDFYPQLPQFDVGDLVTVKLREAGYSVFACDNSLWQPDKLATLPADSPFLDLHADRAFDDQNRVIFTHLGRGVRKSDTGYQAGMTSEGWVSFARQYVLD